MKTQSRSNKRSIPKSSRKIRYAVLGLGHIAQTAMLPAFKHAKKNSELVALVSEDPVKLKKLGRRYGVKNLYDTKDFEACLESGSVDAVYIATPNTDHKRFIEMALDQGIHVLCEKPLAPTAAACKSLERRAAKTGAQLMTGYRLHFDRANLTALKIARGQDLGELRFFSSTFSMQVQDPNNIRLKKDKAGGPLFDIGIYCINAARSLFRSEPSEVFAMAASRKEDKRFAEVDEMMAVTLRFPNERLATFTCSFGAHDLAHYELVGTKGSLCLDSAYEYAEAMSLEIGRGERWETREFVKRDQFAPELVYFSDCLLNHRQVEPAASEGRADVAVIEAVMKSIKTGRAVRLLQHPKTKHPRFSQQIRRSPLRRPPEPIHVTAPHK